MKTLLSLLAICVATLAVAPDAMALTEFKTEFKKKFADTHKSKDFQLAVRKASCNVCHIAKAKKTVQNDFGKLLNKMIEGSAKERKAKAKEEGGKEGQDKEKAKLLEELNKAFDKIVKQKSEDGKGPTYGDLIKEGKLPVDPVKAAAKYKAEQAKKKE